MRRASNPFVDLVDPERRLPSRLWAELHRARIRQRDLAARAGVRPEPLNRWLHGEGLPSSLNLTKLLAGLNERSVLRKLGRRRAFQAGELVRLLTEPARGPEPGAPLPRASALSAGVSVGTDAHSVACAEART